MPLVSSGRPSATGAPSLVVDSMQVLFGRHVGWFQARSFECLASGNNVAVTVEFETS